MKITLNANETNDYNIILNQIPTIPKGTHLYFRDFFKGRTASQRVAIKLREEVVSGRLTGIKLVGTKSSQGYIII